MIQSFRVIVFSQIKNVMCDTVFSQIKALNVIQCFPDNGKQEAAY